MKTIKPFRSFTMWIDQNNVMWHWRFPQRLMAEALRHDEPQKAAMKAANA